jgi:hypothetical protein
MEEREDASVELRGLFQVREVPGLLHDRQFGLFQAHVQQVGPSWSAEKS